MSSFGVERDWGLAMNAEMKMLAVAHKTDGFDGLELEDMKLVYDFAVSHINFFFDGEDNDCRNRFYDFYRMVHKTEHFKTIAFQVSNRTLEALRKN